MSTIVLIQKVELGHPLTKLHNNHIEYTGKSLTLTLS